MKWILIIWMVSSIVPEPWPGEHPADFSSKNSCTEYAKALYKEWKNPDPEVPDLPLMVKWECQEQKP